MAKKYQFTHPDDNKKYRFETQSELSDDDKKLEKEQHIQKVRILKSPAISEEERQALLQKFNNDFASREETRNRGIFKDIAYNTIVGGIRDAGEGVAGFGDFLTKYDPRKNPVFYALVGAQTKAKLEGKNEEADKIGLLINANVSSTDGELEKQYNALIPQIKDPKFTVNKFGRVLTQFAVPYAGISKVSKGTRIADKSMLRRVGEEAIKGGVAEQLAFLPEDERLSNLIVNTLGPDAFVVGPIADFLKSDPNDSEAVARLKMAVEGTALGVSFDFLLRGLGKLRAAQKNKKEIDEAEQKNKGQEVDPKKVEEQYLMNEGKIGPNDNPYGSQTYDEKVAEQIKVKNNIQKDPISFKSGINRSGTGKYGKKEFVFKTDPNTNRVTAFIKDKRTKEEVELAIQGEINSRQIDGETLSDAEIKALRESFTDLPFNRKLGEYENMNTARNETALQFVPRSRFSPTLNPVEPKVRRVNNLFVGKFNSNDYGLEDLFGGDYLKQNLRYFDNKRNRPSDAFDRAGEILTQAGFRGRQGENFSGFVSLENDEITDVVYRNDVLLEDQDKYIQYELAIKRAEEVEELLKQAGYTDIQIGGMREEEVLRALRNYENRVKDIESDISYYESTLAKNSEMEDYEAYSNAHTSRIRSEKRADIEENAQAGGSSPEEAKRIADNQIGPEEGFGGSYVGQGGGKVKTGGPEKAGNINLDRINEPEDVKDMIKDVVSKIDLEAHRRVVPFGSKGEKLRALGESLGLTPDDLNLRKVGQAFNAEQIDASRVLFDEALAEVTRLAREVNADPSDLNRVALQHAMTRATAISEQIVGITAEAGRALRAFKEFTGPASGRNKFVADYLKQGTGRDGIDQIAKAITEIDNDVTLGNFVRKTYKPTTFEKIQEAWINGLLSAPSTHLVNIISNIITTTLRPGEYLLSALVGKARGGKDVITFSEAGMRAIGMMVGALRGADAVYKNLRYGRAFDTLDDPLTKLELSRQKAIGGKVGDVIRIPGSLLALEDAFFKTIGQQQEYFGRAMRQAKKEGKGIKRAFELLKDVSKLGDEVRLAAIDEGRYLTFTKPVEGFAQGFPQWVNKYPIFRYIFPFVRTPVNIVKFAVERVPVLNFVSSKTRKAFAKGGKEMDQEIAKLLMGGSIMGSIAFLSSNGYITGRGPADWKERQSLRELGWRPYSIKLGDTYYSYNRFEPVGILFGLASDLTELARDFPEILKDKENDGVVGEIVERLIFSLAENITNKTFLTGLTGVISMISDPGRYGEPEFTRFLTSFTPTIGKYKRISEDPTIRDAEGLFNNFANRMPGFMSDFFFSKNSKDLPPKRNIFGETREYDVTPGIGGFTFIPINISRERENPVFQEFLALDYFPGLPSRKIGGVELTADQYEDLLAIQQEIGSKRILESIVRSPQYKSAIPFAKQQLLEKGIEKLRDTGRDLWLARNKDFVQKMVKQKKEEIEK